MRVSHRMHVTLNSQAHSYIDCYVTGHIYFGDVMLQTNLVSCTTRVKSLVSVLHIHKCVCVAIMKNHNRAMSVQLTIYLTCFEFITMTSLTLQ